MEQYILFWLALEMRVAVTWTWTLKIIVLDEKQVFKNYQPKENRLLLFLSAEYTRLWRVL